MHHKSLCGKAVYYLSVLHGLFRRWSLGNENPFPLYTPLISSTSSTSSVQ